MNRTGFILLILLFSGPWVSTSFGQSEPAPSPPRLLTLNDAITQALAANPSIAASEQSVAATEAKVDQSWTGFLPQLLLSLSYKRATMNSPAPPYLDTSALPANMGSLLGREEGKSYNSYSAGATLNHTIWDFGKTSGGWKAAQELRAAARSDAVTSKEQVRLNTILAYYSVLGAQEAVAVATEAVRQMERHVTVAQVQAEAGVRQRIDITRAQSDFASAKLNLAKAKNGELIARVNLATAMGLSKTPDFRVERPPAETDPDHAADLDALVRTALHNRPDVSALRARMRASEHQIGMSRAGYYPTLGLSAGVNWQGYKLDSDALPYNWFAGVNATWNALSPIPASAASREAQANYRVLTANLENLELGIGAEVKSAALALQEAKERLEPVAALVTSAEETLRLAEGRYEAGAGSIIEVTDAQTVYTQSRLSQIQAEYDVETARARLKRAMGFYSGLERE
jgi:outer membrane protein